MTWPILRILSEATWLTPPRAKTLGRAFALILTGTLAGAAILILLSYTGTKPMALDFDAFWAGGRLAATGLAPLAYNNAAIEAVERAATNMPPGYLAFYYPPPFLLLCLPLGFFGFTAALALFLGGEMLLLLAGLRRILPQSWAWLPLLSFPGFVMNALSGQNAPLSAACFCGAALWLETRPIVAGMCLGGLVCKPQLALCVPVALLAARRIKALLVCGLTAAALCALSFLVLGGGVWRGFLANAPNARVDIETIAIKWPKLQTAYGTVRLAGGGSEAAYAVQGFVSAAALALLAFVAVRRPGPLLEVSALTAAALLFTPFLYDYDLAQLAVPIACLTALAQKTRWLSWEKTLLLALFLLPLAARPAGLSLGIIIAPPLVFALLAALSRRSRHC